MKILVGLSKGLKAENIPYQMLMVDVDLKEQGKQDWIQITPQALSSCSNVRVNLDKYKSITQNPVEYLEADFDVSRLVDINANSKEFQIINIYTDELEKPVLYRSVDASGNVKIHHISEFTYKKSFSIYGTDLNELPSYVKTVPLKDAYDYWKKLDQVKIHNRTTRFVCENFDTYEDMPVQLFYQYLVGVKGFKLGYHTITDEQENGKLHEYLLFNKSANIKLKENIKENADEEEILILGNKDPYPDERKLGYYGATMSLICNRENYPAFDYYTKPTSEANYDENGIEVTIDLTDGNMAVYNKFEEAGCISLDWRLGDNHNFFGVTLPSLITDKLTKLSKKFQNEKERVEYGHWSTKNTNDWFLVMSFALSTQYYTKELRNKLNDILNDYQNLFTLKLSDMIEKLSAKDTLETLNWASFQVERVMEDIAFIKEDGEIQNSIITEEQKKNLFTFKRNSLDLPDWLQIYSPETIEKLGGVDYLKQFIKIRGEESAELFLFMWAEKIETEQKYLINEYKEAIEKSAIEELDTNPTVK